MLVTLAATTGFGRSLSSVAPALIAAFALCSLWGVVPTVQVLFFRCPRCQNHFALGPIFSKYCLACGLPRGAPRDPNPAWRETAEARSRDWHRAATSPCEIKRVTEASMDEQSSDEAPYARAWRRYRLWCALALASILVMLPIMTLLVDHTGPIAFVVFFGWAFVMAVPLNAVKFFRCPRCHNFFDWWWSPMLVSKCSSCGLPKGVVRGDDAPSA